MYGAGVMGEIIKGFARFDLGLVAVVVGTVWLARRVKGRVTGSEDDRLMKELRPLTEIARRKNTGAAR